MAQTRDPDRSARASRRARCSTGISLARRATARSSSSSGRRDRARPCCSGWSPASSSPTTGRILLGGRDVTDSAAGDARRRHGVPELRAVSAHVGVRQRRERADGAQGAAETSSARRSRRSPRSSRSSTCCSTRRANCPTARSSAPRWRARWSPNRKILLLDDPLRNVDAKLRYEMRLELPSLLKASGSTVLYVTQDYKEAMALGDRIAVLLGPATSRRSPGLRRSIGSPRRSSVAQPVRRSDDQSDSGRAARVAGRAEDRRRRRRVVAARRLCATWPGKPACSGCGRKRIVVEDSAVAGERSRSRWSR